MRRRMSRRYGSILTAVGEASAPYVEEAERKVGQPISYLLRWITGKRSGGGRGRHAVRDPSADETVQSGREAHGPRVGERAGRAGAGHGRARGLAHIGVIRVLEREGIGIDVVAGSSMGSLIAAAWAVGKSADEMEEIAKQIRSKRTFLKLLDPMFPGAGVFRGIKVYNFLHSIVNGLTFADTLIPLKIVASDLNTLEEVVFEEGKLIDAIRASITIPGIFRPVVNNGHTLIDGGITDPVPVQVLAWAGVSKIIAVNTIPNTDEMKQRERSRHEMSTDPRRNERVSCTRPGRWWTRRPASSTSTCARCMRCSRGWRRWPATTPTW